MAKIIELKKEEDEMIPVDQWDGDCWQTFFEQVCVPFAKDNDANAWDYLADFIKKVFNNG